ncbi:MAG: phosphoribosylglycinamide formyltransferase [Lachnospiraceae bacterium]
MLRMVVCVSGGGTNLQAILDALREKRIQQTQLIAVISNNPGAYALKRAEEAGVEGICLSPKAYADRESFNQAFCDKMQELHPDLIVLAGFLVSIPPRMVKEFSQRIINIHPSLIPSFCGVGYYGLKVHEGALSRGVKITGATVHFVDEGMDTGPILSQKAVEVKEDDTPQSLQKRVMEEAEWIILPQVIQKIAAGEILIG